MATLDLKPADCLLIILGIESAPRLDYPDYRRVHYIHKPPTARELLTCFQSPTSRKIPSPMPKPAVVTTAPGPELMPVPTPDGSATITRVLLADDNRINRQLAHIFLNQLGTEVEEACDGAEVLSRCTVTHYDLILMDIHMPKLDGMEATRRLRNSSENINRLTPIVALTADAMNRTQSEFLDVGMNDHLSKPISEQALARTLEKWCPHWQPATNS